MAKCIVKSDRTFKILDEDQIFSEIYSNFYYSKLERFTNKKVILFSNNLKKFSYYLLIGLVGSVPFYYMNALIGLNQRFIVMLDPLTMGMVSTSPNSILEIAASPKQPIINMSLQDSVLSSTRPNRIVVAGLQPSIYSRRLKSPSFISIPKKTYHQYKETYSLNIMESRSIIFSNNGRIVAMAGGIRSTHIEVTNRYLLVVPEMTKLPVEKKVEQFIDFLGSESRLAPLNKTLSLEKWFDLDSKSPKLLFSTETTYGRYKYNSGVKKVIDRIIVEFCKQNPDLGFSLQYRPSEAEHPNQTTQLQSVLLSRKDAYTYQLNSEGHLVKTKEIDLIMPNNIKSIPDWFVYNGEQTIELLEQLYNEGKLNTSPETFQRYGPAIRQCIQGDINDFNKTSIPATAIEFPGQIRAVSVGQKDCERLHDMMVMTTPESLNVEKLTNSL